MKFNVFGIAAIIFIAALGFFIWQTLHSGSPLATPGQATQSLTIPAPVQSGEIERAETAVTTPPPAVAAPPVLDGSDDAVRSAFADIAPKLAQWLTPPEQIRKWVALVDALAEGEIPDGHLPLDYRTTTFRGDAHGEKFRIDQSNFERATPLVDAIIAIPPERLLQYYQHWRPLLERAYRELGRRGSFDTRLRVALSRIDAARPLSENAELTQAGVYYVFSDPQLEKASDVEKLLWRIGPANTQRLRAHVRAFSESL